MAQVNLYEQMVKSAKQSGTLANKVAQSSSSFANAVNDYETAAKKAAASSGTVASSAASPATTSPVVNPTPAAAPKPTQPAATPAPATQTAAAAQTAPAATKTTYIDANGNKKTGYIINGATYQDAAGRTPVGTGSIVDTANGQYIKTDTGSMLYSDYLKQQQAANPTQGTSGTSGGSAYETVYLDPNGKPQKGYIINGKTYMDAAGTSEVPIGSTVRDQNGKAWKKGENGSQLVYSPDDNDYYYADEVLENAKGGMSLAKNYTTATLNNTTGPYWEGEDAWRTGNISTRTSGGYWVYDGKQNPMGYFDSAGNWHPNGDVNDELYKSWEQTARKYFADNGITFTGNGQNHEGKIFGGMTRGEEDGSYINGNKEHQYFHKDPFANVDTDWVMKTGNMSDAEYNAWLNSISESNPNSPNYRETSGLGSGTTANRGTPAQIPAANTAAQQNTGVQQRDMLADEAERQRQIETELAERKRQQEELIRSMTPEDNAAMQQLRDQLAQVDALLEQARSTNDDAYALQLEQLRNRIQTQIDSLNEQYQGINRQLYVDYMMGRRDLPQQLSAMGYTGGLRESSLLNLQNNYEGQLAENERSRLAGIREIESGGLDKELTLGIENIKDNQQAEEKAYDRAATIRAAMISQLNRIEDLSRKDADQARQEAQEQINAYLAAGGTAGGIPASLLQISGYSTGYVNAIAQQTSRKLAQSQADAILKAGGTIPDTLAAAAGYGAEYTYALDEARRRQEAQAQADAILRAGGTLPYDIASAAGYQTSYASAMTEARRRQEAQAQAAAILSAGGVVPSDIAAAAGYGSSYTSALEAARQQQLAQEQANALWKAGGTVSGNLAGAAGYSTDYADALNGLVGGGSQTKPVLTVTQVNDAIKKGILSDQVLSAYEYYYGQPYQQAAVPTYTYNPTYNPPPAPEPEPETTVKTPAQLMSDYQELLFYADEEALAAGTSRDGAKNQIGNWIGNDLAEQVKAGTIDRTTAIQIMTQLGLQ